MSEVFLQDQQSQEEVARRTGEAFKRLGTTLIVRKVDKERRSFSATSYQAAGAQYRQFETSFRNSGGLVEIDVKVGVYVGNGIIACLRLLVDDQQEDEIAVSGRVANEIETGLLMYKKNLAAGEHTLRVQVKVDSGTIDLNQNAGVDGFSTGQLFVKETLGG